MYYTSCCRSPSCAVVPWNSYHSSSLMQEIFLKEFIPVMLPSCLQALMLHLALLLISVSVVFVSLDVLLPEQYYNAAQARTVRKFNLLSLQCWGSCNCLWAKCAQFTFLTTVTVNCFQSFTIISSSPSCSRNGWAGNLHLKQNAFRKLRRPLCLCWLLEWLNSWARERRVRCAILLL